MTKQETLERLKKHRNKLVELNARLEVNLIPYETGIDVSVLDIAIECIEKQIPMEAECHVSGNGWYGWFEFTCPSCGKKFKERTVCPRCYQRVKPREGSDNDV